MLADLRSAARPALVLAMLFALTLGILYPLAMTALGQALFPHAANGSLVVANGRVIGSELIGQQFADSRYVHGRPSAAGTGYDAMASAGSNLGPAARPLADRVAAAVARARAEGIAGPLPADLVTTSASGLDPDLSPAAAELQAPRIARARHLPVAPVRALMTQAIEAPWLGEPHVNVLRLNRLLDAAGR